MLKNRPNGYLYLIALLLFTLFIVFACIYQSRENDKQNQMPGIKFSNSLDYEKSARSGIMIEAASGYYFNCDSLTQEIHIKNPDTNKYAFVLTIYLSDGTAIYQSDALRPGEQINRVKINRTLPEGIYKNVLFVYDFYAVDSSRTHITRCECVTEITSTKENV